MNILFISTGDYAFKSASSIRHLTIAKGLSKQGHHCSFLLSSPQKWPTQTIEIDGFHLKTIHPYSGNNRIFKSLFFYYVLIMLNREIKKLHNLVPIDVIVVYSIENSIIKRALDFSKKYNIPIFHERTELPYIIGKSDTIFGKIAYKKYIEKLIPQFNGLFVISDKLKEYFGNFNNHITKILTVVDTDFFNIEEKPLYDYPYIAYCGTMRGTKDGLPILIEAYKKLLSKIPDIKLLLIGDNSNKNSLSEILDAIDKFNIVNKVVFTGLVERNMMPNLLCHAKLLVVSKPDTEQNSGNFPIKVGEYLSTGVPVVLTKVGEISRFINDGEHGFLAEPNSVDSFYEKMFIALSNSEKAQVIGKNGRDLAKKCFDYRVQSKVMINTLSNSLSL